MTAITHGGLPECLIAAEHHGLWVPPQEDEYVWMARCGHRRAHDGSQCIDHCDHAPTAGARVVSVEHALAQIAACSTDETFFVCLESALRQKKVDNAALPWLLASVSAPSFALIDLARTDADSGIESIVRSRLYRLRIEIRSQWHVPAAGRVDFLIGDRLLIKIEGRLATVHPSAAYLD